MVPIQAGSFRPGKSPGEAREELLALYKTSGRAAAHQRRASRLAFERRPRFGLLLALMNLNGSSWPTYTVGYGSTFADDELADAAETARMLGSKHTTVTITRSSSRRRSRRLSLPWKSRSRLPRLFQCISSVSELVKTSRWPWSDRGRMNCLAVIVAILASATARCGPDCRVGCVLRSPRPSPRCREMRP